MFISEAFLILGLSKAVITGENVYTDYGDSKSAEVISLRTIYAKQSELVSNYSFSSSGLQVFGQICCSDQWEFDSILAIFCSFIWFQRQREPNSDFFTSRSFFFLSKLLVISSSGFLFTHIPSSFPIYSKNFRYVLLAISSKVNSCFKNYSTNFSPSGTTTMVFSFFTFFSDIVELGTGFIITCQGG